MAERSSLAQGVQIGVETTPGTNVAANKKFQSIGIEPGIELDMSEFRAMGNKYPTVIVPNKEWVEADIEGVGSYTELTYLLAGCLASPAAPTTIDTSARKYDFLPATSTEDTVKTFTAEQGGSVRAHKFNYGLVSNLELNFSRDGVEVGGAMIGQKISDNITLTPAPTTLTEKPILATDIDVYLDTTSGGLGTTKLLRVLSVEWSLGDRFNPVWVLNSAIPSFVAHVEGEPEGEVTITMEADAEGMAFLTMLRSGTTKFLRIKGTSPDLAGATTEKYSLTLDQAVKVSDAGDFTDEDGLYCIEWTASFVHDGGWGKALSASIVNQMTAL